MILILKSFLLSGEASDEAAKRMGWRTLKYRLHENYGFLNSPPSVRVKRIGQEKYTH